MDQCRLTVDQPKLSEWGTKRTHKLLTHKLILPLFEPGLFKGHIGLVPGTNWGSAV